jgi:hypothetical protein
MPIVPGMALLCHGHGRVCEAGARHRKYDTDQTIMLGKIGAKLTPNLHEKTVKEG